jgi:hypothetical protein
MMENHQRPDPNDPSETFLADTHQEQLAAIEGQIVMALILKGNAPIEAGKIRLDLLHGLRNAAKFCPNAMFNLGTFLSNWPTQRPKHRERADRLFAKAAEVGQRRLKRPDLPVGDPLVRKEYFLRDIVSRCLTNIGGSIANDGDPASAVPYFIRAIALFPENSNAHVCYGNMAVYFGGVTKLDVLEGLAAWETASTLGDYCECCSDGCSCRRNVVKVATGIKNIYGNDAARMWVKDRFLPLVDKKCHTEFSPVIASPRDRPKVGLKPWPEKAIDAAEALAICEPLFGRPKELEWRITVAASFIVGGFKKLTFKKPNLAILDELLARCDEAEPLAPFIGDHEWRNLQPPETSYLLEDDALRSITYDCLVAREILDDQVADVPPMEAMMGLLFHFDSGFRRGIISMVKNAVQSNWEWLQHREYIAALYVGNNGRGQ